MRTLTDHQAIVIDAGRSWETKSFGRYRLGPVPGRLRCPGGDLN
jgi:hypothetical protein